MTSCCCPYATATAYITSCIMYNLKNKKYGECYEIRVILEEVRKNYIPLFNNKTKKDSWRRKIHS